MWLIISTIFLCFCFVSCTTPHSVRNGLTCFPGQKNITKTDENKIEVKNDITKAEIPKEILEQTYDLNSTNQSITEKGKNSSVKQNNSIKIPTLNEQIKELKDEQKGINERLTLLENDFSELKNSVEDIKVALTQVEYKKPRNAVAGGKENDSQVAENKKDDNTFILSDEAIEAKTNKTSDNVEKQSYKGDSKTKNKIRPEVRKKTSNSKNFTNKKISYDKITNGNIENEPKQAFTSNIQSNEFNIAMNYFSGKDYNRAINILTGIVEKEKDAGIRANCDYWLGESYFGLRQYTDAIKYFIKVLDSGFPEKKDDAQIMIAESQIRSGKIPDAKVSYQKLIEKFPESEYIPRARKMLQQL